jgi:hypothetical protein
MIIIETFERGSTPRHRPTGPMMASGSTPHDNAQATIPQIRSLSSLLLGRLRQRSLNYRTVCSNSARTFIVRPRQPLIHQSNGHHSVPRITLPVLNRLIRRNQIPIASRADCLAATAEFPPIPAVIARGSQLTLRARFGREQMQQRRALRSELLDYFVGTSLQCQRHNQIECPGSLKVDHQLEFGRRLNRQIARILALKDAIDI